MRVLNSSVSAGLLDCWRSWLVPEQQPFFLSVAEADGLNLPTEPRSGLSLSDVERDTFRVWRVAREVDRVVWFSQAEWGGVGPGVQRELLRFQVRHGRGNVPLGRHYVDLLPELRAGRFLWRPEQLTPGVLVRVIAEGQRASQHGQVPERVWHGANKVLPGVRKLAGTFSGGVGNCFGAVMAAAGVPDVANSWVVREPFEQFLQERARAGGRDDLPGTLLVWRSADGLVQHTAVTLGGGWAFEKAAQTWWTPRVVLPVRELIKGNRSPGQKLSRYTLV